MEVNVSPYNYKKVRLEGGSVTLTMGKLIPKDWLIVRLVRVDYSDKPKEKYVTVRIEKVR